MKKINCAVYVRKSTEHGLEMEYNSLHNQEDSCKAYIMAQAFNGWEYYKTYEDGGISGGTMERPGLKRMMDDVEDGKIQIVVVYKVDRLSRSIMDFHRMMDDLKKYDCNFVSVTQAFDTSNSMGKLTLNMLLSFAQFEREVSSERVRDKIAATKAKGMWAGGTPFLGYDIIEKQLVVNEAEAVIVNDIFKKYFELGNMVATCDWLKEQGIKSKTWISKHGNRTVGGQYIQVSYLHRLLKNKTYIGKTEHKSARKIYDGKHKAIVPIELFEKVQAKLARHYGGVAERKEYAYSTCLFNKTLFDEKGNKFGITGCKKGNRRLSYYFNRQGYTMPMAQLDTAVLENINKILEVDLKEFLQEDTKEQLKYIPSFGTEDVRKFIYKGIAVKEERLHKISVYLDVVKLINFADKYDRDNNFIRKKLGKNDGNISLSSDKKYLIVNLEFVLDNSKSTRLRATCAKNIVTVSQMNETLVRGIAYGWKFAKEMEQGKTAKDLEKESGLQHRTIYRYINLKYLSPKIIKDIFGNLNPKNTRLVELMDMADKHVNFIDQEKDFL